MKKKVIKEQQEIKVPLEIAVTLMKPERVEKLRKYVIAYLMKHGDEEQKNT